MIQKLTTMGKVALLAALLLCHAAVCAAQGKDSTIFKGEAWNDQYDVYIRFDLYKQTVTIPQQEIFGQVAGFFGDKHDGRKWPFVEAEITTPTTAKLTIVDDYGSADLTATLTAQDDSTFVLRQESGSTIRIARNRKWVKMPKTLVFKKRR